MSERTPVLVLGLGNVLCGDDGAGRKCVFTEFEDHIHAVALTKDDPRVQRSGGRVIARDMRITSARPTHP